MKRFNERPFNFRRAVKRKAASITKFKNNFKTVNINIFPKCFCPILLASVLLKLSLLGREAVKFGM